MATFELNLNAVAAMRQLRPGSEPDPVNAATFAEIAGVACISIFLRQDRRQVQDRDVYLLKQISKADLNLIIEPRDEMLNLAIDVVPHLVTLIPEQSTVGPVEGGVNPSGQDKELLKSVTSLREAGIDVCLLLDFTDSSLIKPAKRAGATHVRFNSLDYATATGQSRVEKLHQLQDATRTAENWGLSVSVGQGINYHNVVAISEIDAVHRISAGHSVVARSILVGLDTAVRDMIALC